MPNIGLPEILIVAFLLLLVLGPKRLPGLGRTVAGELRDFKDTITGKDREDDEAAQVEAPRDDAEVVQGEVVAERRQ